MKIVVYACIPVENCENLFRRVRITIDGTKVTSVEDPVGDEHHSCNHRSTVHPNYLSLVRELSKTCACVTRRLLPNGDGYSPSSCKKEV